MLILSAYIYWLNTECEILGLNTQTAKIFGFEPDECVGLTYDVMTKLGNWTLGQGNSFQNDDLEVMSTGKS